MRGIGSILSAAIVLGSMAGCGKPTKPAERKREPIEAKQFEVAPREAVRDIPAAYMREHFSRIVEVRDAVMAGDLAATREPSRWLAEHGAPADSPDAWIDFITELRVMSAGLVQAERLDDVARSLGVVSHMCGNCHEALDVDIDYVPGTAPTGNTFEAQMERHKWALDRLWSGLVFPSEVAWERGSSELAFVDLRPRTMPDDPATAGALITLARRVRTLGERATEANDPAERGQVYGELLTTCVRCHTLSRVAVERSPEAHF
jgi:cytochrome c553